MLKPNTDFLFVFVPTNVPFWLEWSNDPESYAGGSVATGRASFAGKVKGDDLD
jgi:hypothetical protein